MLGRRRKLAGPRHAAPDQPRATYRAIHADRPGVRRQRPRVEPLRRRRATDARAVGLATSRRTRRPAAAGESRGRVRLVAIVLAMGSRLVSAPHSALWSAWFRFSCRYTVLFQLAVAVLAAIGFVLVEREAREKGKIQRLVPLIESKNPAAALWRRYEVLGGTVLASVAVAVAGLILQAGHQVASPSRVLVGPLLMASAALLVIAASQGVRGALVGLVLFMAADLGYYGLSCTLDESAARRRRLDRSDGGPAG